MREVINCTIIDRGFEMIRKRSQLNLFMGPIVLWHWDNAPSLTSWTVLMFPFVSLFLSSIDDAVSNPPFNKGILGLGFWVFSFLHFVRSILEVVSLVLTRTSFGQIISVEDTDSIHSIDANQTDPLWVHSIIWAFDYLNLNFQVSALDVFWSSCHTEL